MLEKQAKSLKRKQLKEWTERETLRCREENSRHSG